MKILITGASGMLAHDFITTQSWEFEIVALDRDSCDIADPASVALALEKYWPDVVLNCAAYTAVDDAEDIGMVENYTVNTLGVYNLAKEAEVRWIDLVTISTDYVFDGLLPNGYMPSDSPCPINAYGMAKYMGEKLALGTHPNCIVIRTSWLYGGNMQFKNFVNTMLKLSENRKELRVISDQYWAPTSSADLSLAIAKLLHNIEVYRGKILHLSNETENIRWISWYDFAKEIFHISGKDTLVMPIPATEYPTNARRPMASHILNNSDIRLPEWRSSLAEYIGQLPVS